MDELDALRQMRTTLAAEENPDRLAMRTNWRSAPPKRARRGLKVPMMSLAATAAVVTGTVAVVSLGSDGGSAPVGNGAVQGNVLLVAATNAEKAPSGKYWHTRRILGEIFAVGKTRASHYRVDSRQGSEAWVERAGKGRSGHFDLTDVPVTDQDKQKWQAAGSPKSVKIPDHEGGAGEFILDMTPQQQGGTPNLYPIDDGYMGGLTSAQIAGLPTEPKQLENRLLDLKGNWRVVSSDGVGQEPMRALRGRDRVRAMSDAIGTLLSTAPAPPAVRAAAFRVLANQPGIKFEGNTTDPTGRPGTAVSLPIKSTTPAGLYTAPKQLGTYRRQWIIKPDTGALLAIRNVVATPPKGKKRIRGGDDGKPRYLRAENMPERFHRPGELASYEVFEIAEWTNTAPR